MTACVEKQEAQQLLPDELMTLEQANYNTMQALPGRYEKESSGNASILYLVQTNLFWEKDNAYYREVLVKAGQEVKKGDVLMSFDIKVDRIELETLELQLLRKQEEKEEQTQERFVALEAAKSKLKEKQDTLNYMGDEYDLKIQKLQIDKIQAEFEQFLYQSEREILQIKERIEEIKKSALDNVLTAPFDGVIETVIRYNEGDKVPVQQPLITMYSTDKLLLKVENAGDKLRYNMDVIIETGSKKEPVSYMGKVIAAPNILPSSVIEEMALIELDESLTKEQLKANIRYVAVSEMLEDILLIDRKALEKEDNKFYVHILEGDVVQKRYVVPVINNIEVAWILDGLTEGQTLIVD